ncbi:enoyl-CoA hydratase/isomerase family protein [Conexibacter sp. DBS9H8]|uniref:enoyl-CoA hydratase/isomerase family protein n=1 Tax=Conexibacter sp. DBS9H8 TaxID=2937801 RepID=UPI00200BA50A|nr:enoyl-CoA hydratase/isomerase family protein [Conexibacter sp. DBS9H8]
MTRFESAGPLGIITIAHPPLNLFDDELSTALDAALAEAERAAPRALLVRAEGKVVSGGVDVGKVFDGIDGARGAQLWERLLALTHRVEDLPMPTIFAAHGLTLTAAFEISLACDLLLAAESARFGLVERVVGLTPSMGGTQRLVERAGPARAKELVFTGELFGAATLERWNVVNRVLADDHFTDAARAFALGIAEGPTLAHAATKRIVTAAVRGSARAADAIVPEVSGALFDSEDLRGAVHSFLTDGPGKASFQGR